jgi:hypothetical protein
MQKQQSRDLPSVICARSACSHWPVAGYLYSSGNGELGEQELTKADDNKKRSPNSLWTLKANN